MVERGQSEWNVIGTCAYNVVEMAGIYVALIFLEYSLFFVCFLADFPNIIKLNR